MDWVRVKLSKMTGLKPSESQMYNKWLDYTETLLLYVSSFAVKKCLQHHICSQVATHFPISPIPPIASSPWAAIPSSFPRLQGAMLTPVRC